MQRTVWGLVVVAALLTAGLTSSCGLGLTIGGALGIDSLKDDDDATNSAPGVSVTAAACLRASECIDAGPPWADTYQT